MDPISKHLDEQRQPTQYGTLDDMLHLNPRDLIDGHVFKNTTTNKLYTVSPKTVNLRWKTIQAIRSGEFVWTEITFDEKQQGYVRGADVMSHNRQQHYPDNELRDDMDMFVEISANLDVNSNKHKNLVRNFIQKPSIDLLKELCNNRELPVEWINKQQEANSKWIHTLVLSLHETVFFAWTESGLPE